MTDLQTAYYIIAIVFMSISLVLLGVMVTAVLVIRNKVTHLHRQIDDKLEYVSELSDKASSIARAVKKVAGLRHK